MFKAPVWIVRHEACFHMTGQDNATLQLVTWQVFTTLVARGGRAGCLLIRAPCLEERHVPLWVSGYKIGHKTSFLACAPWQYLCNAFNSSLRSLLDLKISLVKSLRKEQATTLPYRRIGQIRVTFLNLMATYVNQPPLVWWTPPWGTMACLCAKFPFLRSFVGEGGSQKSDCLRTLVGRDTTRLTPLMPLGTWGLKVGYGPVILSAPKAWPKGAQD